MAIEKKKSDALVLPEFLKAEKGNLLGGEKVENSDLVLPRLALCQDLTPQRKKTNSNYIEGLDCGNLFNNVTGDIYGESVDVIPLIFGKSRMWFEEMGKGGGLLCASIDSHVPGKAYARIEGSPEGAEDCIHCKQAQWEEGHPLCGMYHNWVCLKADTLEPLVVSLKSTSLNVSKKWNALVRLANLPFFAKVYTISSKAEKRNNNDYFQFNVAVKGFVTQEQFTQAKENYEALKERKIVVEQENEQEETGFQTEGM